MPPKRKTSKNSTAKSKKGKQDGGQKLRPKKTTDFKQLNSGKQSRKAKEVEKPQIESNEAKSDVVSLTPHSSDDDFGNDTSNEGTSENTSNSAVVDTVVNPDSVHRKDHPSTSTPQGGDPSDQPISRQLIKAVGDYMSKKRKRRNAKKRSKKRRRRDSSSDDYRSSSTSSDGSASESDGSSVSSDSDDSRRARKRRRDERKRSSRKKRKGKSLTKVSKNIDSNCGMSMCMSPSQSTVYTRGCKSPEATRFNKSSDTDSQRSGHVDSDVDSDEFMHSLETSVNHCSPIADRRRHRDCSRSRSVTPEHTSRRRSGNEIDDGQKDEDEARRERFAKDKADEMIRDIQKNKADLAKPASEWKQQLKSLLIDMNRFHLTSHVDRKLREKIEEGDFTVDF